MTILVHSMNRGGAQMRLVTIANGLARDGIDVRFVSVSDEGDAQRLLAPKVPYAEESGAAAYRKMLTMLGPTRSSAAR